MKEWHKLSEEYPPDEGRYLVCSARGYIQIKRFSLCSYLETGKVKDPHFEGGKGVCFWMELPESPSIDWQKLEELKALEEKRAELNKKIKKLKEQLD